MVYAVRMVGLALTLALLASSAQAREKKDEKKVKTLGSTGRVPNGAGRGKIATISSASAGAVGNPKDKAIKAFAGSAQGTPVNQNDYWLMIESDQLRRSVYQAKAQRVSSQGRRDLPPCPPAFLPGV